jgi:hypothetical protein
MFDMSNVAIFIKGSNQIRRFVVDCVQEENDFLGSNCKLTGVKPQLFDHLWTDDTVTETVDGDGSITYDKTVDQLTPLSADDYISITKPTIAEITNAIQIRKQISNLSYAQVENYIENNVTDLESAKSVLKMYGKVILALSKQIDYGGLKK